jgi:hypothetical protein
LLEHKNILTIPDCTLAFPRLQAMEEDSIVLEVLSSRTDVPCSQHSVAAILNPSPTLASLVSIVLAGYLASTLRRWHANMLGITFGPIDTILSGAGILLALAGLYLLKNLHEDTPEPPSQLQSDPVAQVIPIESN